MTHPTRDDAVKDLVQQHWNGRASTFDAERHHGIHTSEQHDRWVSVLREWTGHAPLRVLDVGCGTGVLSLLLAELGHDVAGVDFAPEMLDQARAKARATDHSVQFHCGDAEALAVVDDAYELLTARHLVWTLPNPTKAMQEYQRVLEPGGRVLLIEGYWNHSEPWDEYEQMHEDLPMYDGRPPEELREVLQQVGFDDIEHDPLMDPVLWGRDPHHDYYVMRGNVPVDG